MKPTNRCSQAFTLVELLVIIAVLSLLGTFLLPAFAQSEKSQTIAVRCLENHAQLIKAWQMYAVDSEDFVVNNYTIPGIQSAISKWKASGVSDTWAPNLMTFTVGSGSDSMSTTNTALAQSGLLVPYHRNIEDYRCPTDHFLSKAQKTGGWNARLRSVSMNSNWGRSDPAEPKSGIDSSWTYGSAFRQWHRLAEVRKPADRYVFVDEHADSINDGFFILSWGSGTGEYPPTSASGTWGDIPGFYHHNATPFGFADGHTEMKKWVSRPIPVRADGTYTTGPVNLLDQQWYVQHVAERR